MRLPYKGCPRGLAIQGRIREFAVLHHSPRQLDLKYNPTEYPSRVFLLYPMLSSPVLHHSLPTTSPAIPSIPFLYRPSTFPLSIHRSPFPFLHHSFSTLCPAITFHSFFPSLPFTFSRYIQRFSLNLFTVPFLQSLLPLHFALSSIRFL